MATYVKIGLDSEEIKFQHSKKEIEEAIIRYFGTKDTTDVANVYIPPHTNFTSGDLSEIRFGKLFMIFHVIVFLVTKYF